MDNLKNKELYEKLTKSRMKEIYVNIFILDDLERTEKSISGIVRTGNISVSADSLVRRVASLEVILSNRNNDLDNIEDYLKLNRKVSISIGQKNIKKDHSNPIIWYEQGVYVISSVSVNHSAEDLSVNLELEDKMALLNGDCGGELPCSVTFHSYDQIQEDGSIKSYPQKIYDLIQGLIVYYGKENLANIIINDIPSELKNTVRYTGEGELYYNQNTSVFAKSSNFLVYDGEWQSFRTGENVGYIFTDFVYPKELVSGIGDSVATILSNVSELLENYEFFYDVYGRFIFQEKKNYLNTSYQNTIIKDTNNNNLSVIDASNYKVDFSGDDKYNFDFSNNKELISSISSSPNISNIRNDFHIWGKKSYGDKEQKDIAIHYHLAIKSKPVLTEHDVIYENDGESIRIPTFKDPSSSIKKYTPSDWRAELYLQGLEALSRQDRPDIFQQEIIDNFPSIYNFQKKDFKFNILKNPTKLNYFIDFIEPNHSLFQYSVDAIGVKTLTEEKDEINAIFQLDTPNVVIIDLDGDEKEELRKKCEMQGQPFSLVDHSIYETISLGSCINTAQEYARKLIFEHTNFTENISISCIPVYNLEPNTRIRIEDENSGIHGDYLINSINIPLGIEELMSIDCSKITDKY